MNVLLLTQHDFSWPAELQVLGFARELARQGHGVMLSIGGHPSTLAQEGLADLAGVSVVRHRFVGPRISFGSLSDARAFRPDLVHAWNPRVPTVVAARSISQAAGCPYFVHFEDDDFSPWPVGAGRRTDQIVYAVRRRAWRAYPPAWGTSLPTSLGWVREEALELDAPTPALAEEVAKQLGRPCRVLLPVIETVDLEDEGPSAIERRHPTELVALFTGRVVPTSLPDVNLAIDAVRLLRAEGMDLRLVHTGRVTFGLDLERHAHTRGLANDGFTSMGHVPFRDVMPTLRDADVLIQPGPPSRFNRLRLPSKMQSYLASGTPTVTFAVGFGDLLRDREEVLMTFGDTPTELAKCISDLLQDQALYQRVGKGALQADRRLFDKRTNTLALAEHYARALHALDVDARSHLGADGS